MKRGIVFFPVDLTWFLLFIVVATLLFFFAFKPLHDKINNHALTNLTQDTDANYISLSLPRMKVIGQVIVKGGAPPSYDGKEFSDLIREMLNEKDPPDIQTASAYPDYLLFLDSTIPNLVNLTYEPKELHIPERYAIVLGDSSGYYEKTCVEYTVAGRANDQFICGQLSSFDPATGKPPVIYDRNGGASQGTWNGQSGRAYIPTDNGAVFIQVFIRYKT